MRPAMLVAPFSGFMTRPDRLFVHLALLALFTLLPLSAFAQEERAAEKAAAEKARQEAAAKQQASPETVKPADELKKPEDEKAEEEKKPADPMSSPTFN